jgi:DNA processing protein
MITARFAGEHGKLIFAVPGRIDQPTSRGCHQLIRDGATLLTGVDDILAELNYLDGLRPAPVAGTPVGAATVGGLSDAEQRVFECFRGGSILNIDTLVGLTQMPAHELGATLMLLELKRLVVKRLDGAFEARGG